MRRRAFALSVADKRSIIFVTMARLSRISLAIGAVAFCLGIALGRFSVSTNRAAISAAASRSTAPAQSNAPVPPENSRTKKTSSASVEESGDVYSEIKSSLTATGTSRLYESFGKFSHLIDEKNVRDVLAFAEKIPQKEQKEAVTLLVL